MSKKKADQILIRCEGAATLGLDDLVPFQGQLKELSKENYERLRGLLIKHGFSFPFVIWRHEGKNYVNDGHQRLSTLLNIREDGEIKLPEQFPVVWVEADDYQQAKEKLLAATSQFGVITGQGLYEFIAEAGLDWRPVVEEFRFPDLNVDNFVADFYADVVDPKMPGSHEEKDDYTFKIKCDSLDELNDLQNFFEVTNTQVSYEKFRGKAMSEE